MQEKEPMITVQNYRIRNEKKSIFFMLNSNERQIYHAH